MEERVIGTAMLAIAVAAVKELIVPPCVRFLHRKGVLHGPVNPTFLSPMVRWRNIFVFLAFLAIWVSLFCLLPQAMGWS
jgi:uncharacterized membrane protein